APSTCDLARLGAGPAKASAHDARLCREMSVAVDLGLDGAEARIHALPNHAALELGKGSHHVEQQPTHRRGGVDVLRIQVEVDAGSFQMLDEEAHGTGQVPSSHRLRWANWRSLRGGTCYHANCTCMIARQTTGSVERRRPYPIHFSGKEDRDGTSWLGRTYI